MALITKTHGVPKLPNHLIMEIIKLADGGKVAHSVKFKQTLKHIEVYIALDFKLKQLFNRIEQSRK